MSFAVFFLEIVMFLMHCQKFTDFPQRVDVKYRYDAEDEPFASALRFRMRLIEFCSFLHFLFAHEDTAFYISALPLIRLTRQEHTTSHWSHSVMQFQQSNRL
jgi:hypothetical protein